MTTASRPTVRRKLIEVALPLEAINRESAREKSIRHGHPSTLHLWWARRPLAACRAVLFAQLVDDPSSQPERFPTEREQTVERQRLFSIIERLVSWDSIDDAALYREARDAIAGSFQDTPLPIIVDPFAGGGSIPLEAQRLGLTAHASDLNPVAVLVNKALIELPAQCAGQTPVFPGAATAELTDWTKARGLAEDVRRYGAQIREEAESRIGHIYTDVALPQEYGGGRAPVLAWLWARTVKCPNPACGLTTPLLTSFTVATKRGKERYIWPIAENGSLRFEISPTPPDHIGVANKGYKRGVSGVFACAFCGTVTTRDYVAAEGMAGRLGAVQTAVVALGKGTRVYLPPEASRCPTDLPPVAAEDLEVALAENPRDVWCRNFGLTTVASLFTPRQTVALTTFCDLVAATQPRIAHDAENAGMSATEATLYANTVVTYLAFVVSRTADYLASTTTWASNPQMEILRNTFARQALGMTWDFAEGNPFGASSGSIAIMLRSVARAIDCLPAGPPGVVHQSNAATANFSGDAIVTDPPYYDNIGYADLSDFFYVWLRRMLIGVYPDLLSTVATPKTDELVALPYRFGGLKRLAEAHFEDGFIHTFSRVATAQRDDIPISIFYAFKQSESGEDGVASTGWETMLNGLVKSGLSVTATWPIRTERAGRTVGIGTNALAGSIVLACRPLPLTAESIARRGFIQALQQELPQRLRELTQGSVAPVDLAQAAVGPGMGVFTRYRQVLEADGSAMTVRTALALINQTLDELLSEQEGDFDAVTRFGLKWYSQFGWEEADSGVADTLTRATNTSLASLERGGIFRARAGRARLLAPDDLSQTWDPLASDQVSVWAVVLHAARALQESGGGEAARLMSLAAQRIDLDTAKELAYLLYSISDKRDDVAAALLFNGLGTSWSELAATVRATGGSSGPSAQGTLDLAQEDE